MEKAYIIKKENEEKYFHFGSTFVESDLEAHFFSSKEEAELVRNKIVNKFGIQCIVYELSEKEKKDIFSEI